MTPPPLSVLAAREGFESPGAEAFYWPSVVDIHVFGLDISLNRTAILLFVATVVLAALFLIGFRRPSLVPRGLQNLLEYGVGFVRDQIIMPTLGKAGLPYLPYLTTLFFFIFLLNLFGEIPGINFAPTSRIGIPIVLALFSYLWFLYEGGKKQGVGGYVKGILFPPGVPIFLYLILTPVEIVSTFIVRPASLAIRLMANMIAGHLLLTVFFLGTTYLYERPLTIGFGVVSMFMSVVFTGFEIFVGALQAFIFCMLTAVYVQTSREAAH